VTGELVRRSETVKEVARPVRFELTTYSFGGCRSIHLSYGRTVAIEKKELQTRHREDAHMQLHIYFNAWMQSAP
jgi:hypothetical protein